MKCVVAVLFLAYVAVNFIIAEEQVEEWKCDPQERNYIENECNDCSCGTDRLLSCTEKGCFNEGNQLLRNCKVGSHYEKDCNECWCVKDIGTVCTRKNCIAE